MATKRDERMAKNAARTAAENAAAAREATRQLELKLQITRDSRANDPSQRNWQLGMNVGAAGVGMALGHLMAKGITKRAVAAQAVKSPQLKALAKSVAPLVTTASKTKAAPSAVAKLAAIVKTADKMGLTKVRGPLGIASAGALLAEGLASRFLLAPKAEGVARDALNAVGTGSMFAANAIVSSRALANAMPKALPPAKALATIEQGRALAALHGGAKVAKQVATGPLAKAAAAAMPAARLAGRAIPIVGWGLAAAGATFNAIKTSSAGGSVKDVAISAARGFVGLSARIPPPTGEARMASARAALARSAAARGSASRGSASLRAARVVAAAKPSSDGMTKGYVRQQGGKSVSVKVYRTPR